MSNKETKRSKQKKYISKKWNSWMVVNSTFLLLNSMLIAFAIYLMYRYQFLAFNYVNHLLAFGSIASLCLLGWLIIKRKAQKITFSLLLVMLFFAGGAVYALNTAIHFAQKVTSKAEYAELELTVVALVDSPLNDVKELTALRAPVQSDEENIAKLVEQVQKYTRSELVVEEASSYVSAYEALVRGEVQAIALNSAYKDLIATVDSDYEAKIKTIYTYKTTQEIEAAPVQLQDLQAFNVYISGIDTYGPVSTVSRSDVNIIMSVNRQTKTILLTTTPRDSYVPIANAGNDQYDKLTHAGIYGLNTSMQTLENLYGIDLHYYLRLNFTSFLKLIDHVGGITVTNDQAFTSLHGNYEFPVGPVTMNAEQALSFVRERYSLSEGDHDRGKNQEKVIAALIDKLTSPAALQQVPAILADLGTSIQTNMDLTTMNALINDQLSSNTSYRVISQAVTGTGTMELPSYAMPNTQLYMLQIDPNSLAQAQAQMQQVLEGETP